MSDAELKLTEEGMRYITLFERVTGAVARDCIVYDDKIIFVVKSGQMGMAIGKSGANVDRIRKSINKEAELIEYSDNPEDFVANAFQPALVENVEVETKNKNTVADGDHKVAIVEIDDNDKGLAIGKEGKNIRKVKNLAKRHHGIDDVILE